MKKLVALVATYVLAMCVATIVIASMNWRRGIYASMHYNDAETDAAHVLADNYGLQVLGGMRFDTPNVVNTHLDKIRQQTTKANSVVGVSTGQVRVFHYIGREGVRYCVGVWDIGYWSGSYSYGRYFITKNCIYSENQ